MTSKFRSFASYKPELQDAPTAEILKQLAREFGRDRVEKGLHDAIFDRHREDKGFPPCPADLRTYVEHANTQPIRLRAANPDCKACDGTGWEYLKKQSGVRICDCRRL